MGSQSGRLVGILLIAGGAVVCLGAAGWLAVNLLSQQSDLQAGGAALGALCAAVIVLPLFGGGVFLLARSRQEARQEAVVAKQRKLLDMVKSRGQLSIADLVLELQSSRDEVQGWVHSLVGMGLFSGYINWDDGVLYSAEAASLRDLTACKKCGGQVQLAGKGVVKCPYCGTEYFLS